MSSTLPILHPELIAEILSWLPVKILIRFTSVSKHWKSLIFDPTFAKLHLQRSHKHSHVLLTSFDTINSTDEWILTPYSVSRLLEHSTVNEDECLLYSAENVNVIIGSTNGLLCLLSVKSRVVEVQVISIQFWNPSLRLRSKSAPTLTVGLEDEMELGFGYDDLSDTYKVVAVFWDGATQKTEGRVHCMGDSCWRKTLACVNFPILVGTGSFVNKSVNWLAMDNLNGHQYNMGIDTVKQCVIFSLDLGKETCMHMLLPDSFDQFSHDGPTLAVSRGHLCFYYEHMKTHFVLWEMREFGVQESWTQLANISYVHLEFDDFVGGLLPFLVCLSENGDVLLLAHTKAEGDVIMYNLRDDRVEHIALPNNNDNFHAVEHMQSLVLPLPPIN